MWGVTKSGMSWFSSVRTDGRKKLQEPTSWTSLRFLNRYSGLKSKGMINIWRQSTDSFVHHRFNISRELYEDVQNTHHVREQHFRHSSVRSSSQSKEWVVDGKLMVFQIWNSVNAWLWLCLSSRCNCSHEAHAMIPSSVTYSSILRCFSPVSSSKISPHIWWSLHSFSNQDLDKPSFFFLPIRLNLDHG